MESPENQEFALHKACAKNNKEHVLGLLMLGADPTVCDSFGQSPVHYCSDPVTFDQLLKFLPIDAQDYNGHTPLHNAVIAGDDSTVKMLLKKKANLLVRDKNNLLPAHFAMMRESTAQLILFDHQEEYMLATLRWLRSFCHFFKTPNIAQKLPLQDNPKASGPNNMMCDEDSDELQIIKQKVDELAAVVVSIMKETNPLMKITLKNNPRALTIDDFECIIKECLIPGKEDNFYSSLQKALAFQTIWQKTPLYICPSDRLGEINLMWSGNHFKWQPIRVLLTPVIGLDEKTSYQG